MVKKVSSLETKLACIVNKTVSRANKVVMETLTSETLYLHSWTTLTKDSLTDIVKDDMTFNNDTYIQQRLNDQSLKRCYFCYAISRAVPQLFLADYLLLAVFSTLIISTW